MCAVCAVCAAWNQRRISGGQQGATHRLKFIFQQRATADVTGRARLWPVVNGPIGWSTEQPQGISSSVTDVHVNVHANGRWMFSGADLLALHRFTALLRAAAYTPNDLSQPHSPCHSEEVEREKELRAGASSSGDRGASAAPHPNRRKGLRSRADGLLPPSHLAL